MVTSSAPGVLIEQSNSFAVAGLVAWRSLIRQSNSFLVAGRVARAAPERRLTSPGRKMLIFERFYMQNLDFSEGVRIYRLFPVKTGREQCSGRPCKAIQFVCSSGACGPEKPCKAIQFVFSSGAYCPGEHRDAIQYVFDSDFARRGQSLEFLGPRNFWPEKAP